MNFPISLHLHVNNAQEYEAVVAVLRENDMVGRLRISDSGRELPEAYLLVDGRRITDGTRSEMETAFANETAAHRAAVSLYARPIGALEYKRVKARFVPLPMMQ